MYRTLRNTIYYNFGKTTIPLDRIVNIELTNRCNQRCFFCPVNNKRVLKPITRVKSDMNVKDFEKIVKNYRKYCDVVNLSHHGETFLYPKLKEAILILKKYGVDYSLTTNGSLVGKYIDILTKYPPKLILFSLYTVNSEKFKKLTATGDLKIVLKNIQTLLDLKTEGKINTKIVIRVIDMYGFEKDVEDVKKYFKDKNVEVDVGVLNSWAGRVDIKKYGKLSNHTMPFKYCFQPWRNCIIGSDTGIYICNNHEDEPIDYLNDGKKIEEIWNNRKYQKIRSNILHGYFANNEICENCDYFNLESVGNRPTPFFFLTKNFLFKIMYVFGLLKCNPDVLIKMFTYERNKKTFSKKQ